MSAINISFTIQGEKQVLASIDFAGREISDLRQPLQAINDFLLQDWDIKKQGKEIGESWQPLNPAYAAKKAQTYGNKGILIRTGAMNRMWKTRLERLQTTLWNNADYFKYHQSNAPRKRLPRRVMMKIGLRQQKDIFMEFTRYLNKVRSHFDSR